GDRPVPEGHLKRGGRSRRSGLSSTRRGLACLPARYGWMVVVDRTYFGGSAGRSDPASGGEPFRVDRRELLPIIRHVVFVQDRLAGTHGLARSAVHAPVGVDVEHARSP